MNIDKQALRERYSPKPAPECHICGKEMTIQRMSASRITYGCTGATYDDKGCHYAEDRSIADDHYEQSRVTVVDVSDPDVLALLDELEAETRYREGAFIACNRWHDKFREADDKLEAAERRKVLISLAAVARRYLPDYDEHPEIQAADELLESAAGIGVKQQEDSVDSDVGSRNQPGMVVAVHIDAGDFVKVKGQVFEVEETDFDDHDVTLWFVGGNALKYSAGCQVEVVSAPVAAGIKVKES
ncbi:ead/Ea22-like family protein [Salmonella enterica subsp. diarizonae]|nr:ead/Ea22-like family protein [Salmonella enterica]EAZ3127091.1 ead/Ea22-like family protein [Salmonella enterica]ECC9428592.1 ead/Ea22-like family protein [Salmonella enterica subsp. diarizonae]ECI5696213.1 ead/Ea22-like family protein [Salmonella enterica subsp. diarizonae]